MAKLTEADWRFLVASIRQKQCVLMLGHGVSLNPMDLRGEPLPALLARQMAAELKLLNFGARLIKEDDLAHVAQIYEREMPRRRQALELEVENFYTPYRNDTTQLHRDLATLPFTLGITTSPDRFLSNAFRRAGKSPIQSFYRYEPNPRVAFLLD